MSARTSPLPRPWGLLRRLGELALVGLAVTLTVANTATAPYLVRESVVLERKGSLPMKLDSRAYTDHPFQVEFPGGTYSTVTLYRMPSEPGRKRERILQFTAGDPRLQGDPVRLRILLPSAEGLPPKRGTYRLMVTDEQDQIHELSFELVDRPVKQPAEQAGEQAQ